MKDIDIVLAAERLVLEALPKRLTEDTLAAAINVDILDLQQAFMAVRGDSVYRAIIALRLGLVDQILNEDRTQSPNLVARQCGFGYYGTFLRAYRQQFHCEPSRTRNNATISEPATSQASAAALDQLMAKLNDEPGGEP
jgi:transcriptional regulator GlxA family with amidase domain